MLSERNNLNKETEVQETVNDDPDLHLLLDERRFSTMERLVLKCSNCTAISEFQGPIQRTDDGRNVCGLMCKRCGVIQNSASVQTQIRIAIADFIQKYYDSLYQCNEPSCGYHTRDMIGQCPNPTCNGHLLRDVCILVKKPQCH
jgi:hypothetical protein